MKYLVGSSLLLLSLSASAIDKYCSGAPTVIHTNGGGRVALTAQVAPTAFVGPEASVCEFATVTGVSEVRDSSRVYGYARVNNGTIISGNAEAYGNSIISSNAFGSVILITDSAKVYGNSKMFNSAIVRGTASVFQNAVVKENSIIEGAAQVFGNATVGDTALIQGNAKIFGNGYIGGNVVVKDNAQVCVGRYYEGGTVVTTTSDSCANSLRPQVTSMYAGFNHTCITTASGMKCWGRGSEGQLGYGNTNNIGDDEIPFHKSYLTGLSSVSSIGLGTSHTCVTNTNSSWVQCWGAGSYGQLGNGSLNNVGDQDLVVQKPDFAVTSVINKLISGKNHNCVLYNNNTSVLCWGRNDYGQLGYGNTIDTGISSPLNAGALSVTALGGPGLFGTRGHHTCIGVSAGIRCWGLNNYGQLGLGHTNNIGDDESITSVPAISFSSSINSFAVGENHACVLFGAGTVKCWGRNNYGQLGYGHTNNIGDDELAKDAPDVQLGGVATQIYAGDNHTCAKLSTGLIKCWGKNDYGQLGYPHTQNLGDDEVPSSYGAIANSNVFSSFTLGNDYSCSVTSFRSKCWGKNDFGQLGYGHTSTVIDPNSSSEIMNFSGKY